MATATKTDASPDAKDGASSPDADRLEELEAQLKALSLSQAIIELDLDGTILTANENYLAVVGYALDEIVGKHHSELADAEYVKSVEYQEFWRGLTAGENQVGEYKLRTKDGSEAWIQGSYDAVLDDKGNAVKVVGCANDATEQVLAAGADFGGMIHAISRSQAMIEFELDGTIITANANFLDALGYTLEEIQGQHHRIFAQPDYAASADYASFWKSLATGEYHSGEYLRVGKDGQEIWIQASYNPILDPSGNPYKIVKFATDITAAKLASSDFSGQVAAISKSQAVIEFELDGTIITANANFLDALGYTLEEVQGQHHRIFAEPDYAASADYASFWKSLATGEYHSGEYLRIGKDGQEIWIQASYNPILDPSGNPYKVVKFATDITKQVEERFEAARLSSMVENTSMNMMTVDTDLIVRYINPATRETLRNLEEALATPVDQMIGQSIDIFHKHPAHQMLRDPSNLPHRAMIEIGPETLDLLLTAMYDSAGQHIGAMATWEVITERLKILEVIEAAASGDFTMEVVSEGADVFAKMASGLGKLLDSLKDSIGSIAQTAGNVSASAEQLTQVSMHMGSTAEETSTQANVVSEASGQVSDNVGTVAAASEEMSASIKEIAKSSSSASSVAVQAVEVAATTSETVTKLGESSNEIGQIVKVITSIAQQTNLLALNATIEAARAGEVGKGFAVVANEVKELAKETAQATEDIAQKIEVIQSDTGSVVDAIGHISGIIDEISDIQTTIASAVEEQAATTSEIGRNVTEAARGSSEITQNITSVAEAASSTSSGANETLESAKQLSAMATELQSLVSGFTYE